MQSVKIQVPMAPPPESAPPRHSQRRLPDALAMPVRGEISPCRIALLSELVEEDFDAWERLGERAGTDNIYACPWMMAAGLLHCDPKGEARLFIVTDKVGEWVGALPLMHRPSFGRFPAKNWHSWAHDNQFLNAPLVARGQEHSFWRSVLKALDDHDQRAFALTMSTMIDDDRVFKGLESACADDDRRIELTGDTMRPMLHSSFSFDRYWSTTVTKKRQDRMYKLAAQLEEEFGEARFEIMRDPAGGNEWARTFIALEQKGWRGKQGESLASSTFTEDYFRDVVAAGLDNGTIRLMSLRVGDRVCAMYAYFITPGYGHGFKMVVDEEFAPFAPTTMILREITKVLDDPNPILFDSCAKAGQQPVSSVWMDRRRLIDVAVELKGNGSGFGTIMGLRGLMRGMKALFSRKASKRRRGVYGRK
jgi:CelD/BcsL family acetyltransferase involved in cellulose biosynthesis